MILKWIFDFLISLANLALGLIPVVETPVWIVSNLPTIINTIVSFNNYVPVYEMFIVVTFTFSLTLTLKIIKVLLNFWNIDLNV